MTSAPQQSQPDPTEQLTHHAYYQLIHTLCEMLPPPLADTPEAMLTRNQAAIARIAAMAPVNDDEAAIAAHCVAARAQAEDVMRSLRCHTGDIQRYMKLNAQYALMERTAVSIRTSLLRLQTARHKREADGAAANCDEWMRHIAGRRMQQALDRAAPPAVSAAEPAVPALSGEPLPMPEAVPTLAAPKSERVFAGEPSPAPAAPTLMSQLVRTPAIPAHPSNPAMLAAPAEPAMTADATVPSVSADLAEPAIPTDPAGPAIEAAPAAQAMPAGPAPRVMPADPTAPAMSPGPTAPAISVDSAAPAISAGPADPGAPLSPAPIGEQPPGRQSRSVAKTAGPLRDLAAEADHYAGVYSHRARSIRQSGGLPLDCNFGPPDDDLVRAIAYGASPALCALDDRVSAVA